MSFGFGINDFIQVSHLAFKLFRKCRDSPKDFANLSSEVANLQVVVDDVRLTIREQQLDEAKTGELLHLGQGCLDCLLELEGLLRRYHSLGTKSKRTFDRIGFEKDKVSEIRQRVISNAGLLNAFTNSLTRSSVARLEAVLNRFIDEYRHGQHEGSVISKATVESVQKEDDDVWKEIVEELQEEGITPEQITENKQLIKERIVAALSGSLDRASLVSGSYCTATEGGSTLLTGSTVFGENLPSSLDWPGPLFRWMKELVQSVMDLYRDAPEQLCDVKDRTSELWNAIVDVNYEVSDASTLMYHENLSRKKRMEPIINDINQILRQLARLEGSFKSASSNSELGHVWTCEEGSMQEAHRLAEELANEIDALQHIFRDFGTIVLCNIEDRVKLIVGEIKARERSRSVLSSWEDMESCLADNVEIAPEDVARHQEAIQSFLRILTDDPEVKDIEAQALRNDSSSIGDSSRSRAQFPSFSSLPPIPESRQSKIDIAKSKSSLSGSEALEISSAVEIARMKPKRTSVLFIDLNNTERGPIAQAYLEYLMAEHPSLATCFSRVLSAGLSASKPGVPLPPGVEFLLRDYGICENFQHISRRLEQRDIERFDYILAMNQAQMDEVLARYPTEVRGKVVLLGSFNGYEAREVSHPESIHGSRFFHIGSKRIYPGYDKCLQEIKAYIADFVLELTGFNVHSPAHEGVERPQEDTSREISSEDEDYSSVYQGQPRWLFDEERPGFDELSRAVMHFEETTDSTSPNDSNEFPPRDSPISVRIKPDPEGSESDEQILHKHHERFNRLVSLLSTDIGDPNVTSLRHHVLDWESDNTRNLLSVSTGGVQWALEKISSEANDTCSLCLATGSRCGFVRDRDLNFITTEEADLLAKYLTIAIQQYRHQKSTTEDESRALEEIRDNPAPGPRAPPSIRDDVSVSVRADKPNLTHDVAMIRKSNAQNGQLHKSNTFVMPRSPKNRPKTLVRRATQNSDVADLPAPAKDGPLQKHRVSNASDATVRPTAIATADKGTNDTSVKERKAIKATGSPARNKAPLGSVAPVSVLFLSTAQLHGAIMAQVYLDSLITKSLALANKACDNVSAGVAPLTPADRFNPKKLERLFKNHDLLTYWPKKPQRVLLPEDVMDFNHILLLNGATKQCPFDSWINENSEEAKDMQEKAEKEGKDWKANFKPKIRELSAYLHPANPTRKTQSEIERKPCPPPLMDPVQRSEESTFGVRLSRFENHFQDVKRAVDGFLLAELSYDVETMEFVKRGVTAV